MENQLKATELRLGNYVDYDNRIFKIDTLAEEFPTLDTDEFGIGVVDWNNLKAIPLTEDILVKLGFEHLEDDAFQLKINGDRTLQINHLDDNAHLWLKDEFSTAGKEYVFISHPKYLHQLQNLFFSLTGEELTFKN